MGVGEVPPRPGDIGTHNRYECKVVSVNFESKKIEIAYAVFVGEERIFDEHNLKTVPFSRFVLVQRPWSNWIDTTEGGDSDTGEEAQMEGGVSPSFSERNEIVSNGGKVDARRIGQVDLPMVDLTFSQPEQPQPVGEIVQDKEVCEQTVVPTKKRKSDTKTVRRSSVSDRSGVSKARRESAHPDGKRVRKSIKSLVALSDSEHSDTDSSSDSSSSSSSSSSQMSRTSCNVSPNSSLESEQSHRPVSNCERRVTKAHVPKKGVIRRAPTNPAVRKPRLSRVSVDGGDSQGLIPIVSDSDFDSSSSSGEEDTQNTSNVDMTGGGDDEWSQERERMESLAAMYERRSKRAVKNTDEVAFVWDDRRSSVVSSVESFILNDTPPTVDFTNRQPKRRSLRSLAEFWFGESERVSVGSVQSVDSVGSRSAGRLEETIGRIGFVETVKTFWTDVDSLHVPVVEIPHTLELTTRFISQAACLSPPNAPSELRMVLTMPSTSFKSVGGWMCALSCVMQITAIVKCQLLSDFCAKLADKVVAKLELRLCYAVAYAHLVQLPITLTPGSAAAIASGTDAIVNTTSVKDMLSQYTSGKISDEGKGLLDVLVLSILKTPSSATATPMPSLAVKVTELLPLFGAIVSSACPCPITSESVSESSTEKLLSPFIRTAIVGVAKTLPFLKYFPLLVKSGGFLPPLDLPDRKLTFGKHVGMAFKDVIRDRGFCDWTDRIVDPSTHGFVDWIDFVALDRAFCVIGPRTVRADVERLRIIRAGNQENMKSGGASKLLQNWLKSRGAAIVVCVEFYQALLEHLRVVDPGGCGLLNEFVAYARCAYAMFATLVDLPPIPPTDTVPKPRAEIVKELFRPIMKLAQIFPESKSELHGAVLAARACSHGCSLDEARSDLRNIHGLSF